MTRLLVSSENSFKYRATAWRACSSIRSEKEEKYRYSENSSTGGTRSMIWSNQQERHTASRKGKRGSGLDKSSGRRRLFARGCNPRSKTEAPSVLPQERHLNETFIPKPGLFFVPLP